MPRYPEAVDRLIQDFTILPGVGRKTAERYVFHLLRQPEQTLRSLALGLQDVQKSVTDCAQCYNIAISSSCEICSDSQRDPTIVCVVTESSSLHAIEQTGDYRGVYHVLGGTINQLDGIGPDELRIKELVERVEKSNNIKEIIIATNPNISGESTALYVIDALKDNDITITRLARGLPAGSDIQYADDVTLGNAMKDRKTI